MNPDKRGFIPRIPSLAEWREEDLRRHMLVVRDHRQCHPAMACRRLLTVDGRAR